MKKIKKQKRSFQKNIFLLFLLCAVVPLMINTFLNVSLYSLRLSDDTTQKYNNVLSSLGSNIEAYLDEMERLSLSPYQYDDMMNLYTYISTQGNHSESSPSQWSHYVTQYERIATRLTALSSTEILGLAFFPTGPSSDKGFVYRKTDCRLHEFSAEDYPLDSWFSYEPFAYKYVTYCAPHTVSYYDNEKDCSVFSVVKPIRLLDSKKDVGFLKIDVSTKLFHNLFSEISISDLSCITILSEQDKIIYATNEATGKTFLDAYLSNPDSSGVVCSYSLKKNEWKMLYFISYMEFYKPILETLLASFVFGIPIFLFSIWNYRKISSRFTKPLQNILYIMHEAEEGNLDARADETLPMNEEFEQITIQLNRMIESLDEHIKKEFMAVISQKNAQYQALQAQINPHFLYNTLNNFVALNRIGERKLLEDSIIQLTRIFHYTCSNSGYSTLQEEFSFIEHYLFLQKIRFEERLEFSLHLDHEAETFLIPRLLIQPLVENAIVHGMEDYDKPTRVEVDASLITLKGIGTCIFLAVMDNGTGFDKKKLNIKNSVGLLNIQERLQLFQTESFFEIHSAVGKYTGSYMIIRNINTSLIKERMDGQHENIDCR